MLTVYKASAGSGKTYTLAYKYIRTLLATDPADRRPHSHILAITFTRKATAEMKSRIIKELDALSRVPEPTDKDTPYAASLADEFGWDRPYIASRAAKALSAILHDYDAFNVSTIDSFFQQILRNFAREIDRQGDYRVELDGEYVLKAALGMLFDEVNDRDTPSAHAIGKWLNRLSGERMALGYDFNPFNRSGRMYDDLIASLSRTFDEHFNEKAAEIEAYMASPDKLSGFIDALNGAIASLASEEAALASKVFDAIAAEGFEDNNISANLSKWLRDSIANPGIGEKYFTQLYTKIPAYVEQLRDHSTESKVYANLPRKRRPSVAVDEAIFAWFDHASHSLLIRHIYGSLLKRIDTLRALSYIKRFINQYRIENNMILLADTNSLLGSIISESDTPFIYERVGMELRHFLIDEFQDTSSLQWRNLRPLLANSVHEHDSLIIGDVKQSIYRWRGADSSLLGWQVSDVDFPDVVRVQGDKPGQNSNYRSSHTIVRFNNTLFRALAHATSVTGYEGIEQALPDATAHKPAYIVMRDFGTEVFAQTAAEFFSPDELSTFIPEQGKPDVRRAALTLLGRDIIEQHNRAFDWRDIMILVRYRSSGAEIAEFLRSEFPEIPLVSEEALLVRNSPAVKLIVSMLEIIDRSYAGDNPAGEVSAADASPDAEPRNLRRRRAVMIDRFEYFLAHGEDAHSALQHALDVSHVAPEAPSLIDDLAAIRHLAPASLTALVEAIISLKVSPEMRRSQLAYINSFVDLVIRFSKDHIPTIHAFLDYWHQNEQKLSIGSGDDVDAVSIMTVHKAKGLERPCVHVPLMAWNLEGNIEDGWYHTSSLPLIPPELCPPIMHLEPTAHFGRPGSPFEDEINSRRALETADNLNVAYVALTRPASELHITLLDTRRGIRQPILDAIATPTPDADIYINIYNSRTEAGNYIIGSPITIKRIASQTETTETLADFHVAFTPLNAPVAQIDDLTATSPASPDDPDIGNDPTPDPDPTDPDLIEAARRGTDLHNILAGVTVAEDLDPAIDRAATRLDPALVAEYRTILHRAFDQGGDLVKSWFDPQAERILTEQPIYSALTDENFRPDRIVWTAQGTIDIIDYKFTTEVWDKHLRQVRNYAALMRSMGYPHVRAYLWYPAATQIVPVTT